MLLDVLVAARADFQAEVTRHEHALRDEDGRRTNEASARRTAARDVETSRGTQTARCTFFARRVERACS